MERLHNVYKFQQFRQEYDFFSYEGYSWHVAENELLVEYSFNLSGRYLFTPKVRIPFKQNLYRPFDSLSHSVMDKLVFYTGMIELVSYWKAACPKKVIIRPGLLTQMEVDFWKKLYFNGLGEFFYLNSIDTDVDDFMEIIISEDKHAVLIQPGLTGGSLVPVGGGKDSAVSMELMNRGNMDWVPMTINPGTSTRNVIGAAIKRISESVEIYREIHPLLLELNAVGFLNGHTPFSALLAFYSLIAAYLTGRPDIILSNESSASEVTVPGTNINHQYSKSLEFEADFRDYVRQFISEEFNYFSLLRPISELQIARLFSGMDAYHKHFRSCNAGSKTNSWCCHCPKCLFTFIILSPFLAPERLNAIFGKNLLDDLSLATTLEELSGAREIKPFECIGTIEEVNMAMDAAVEKYGQDNPPALIMKHMHDREMITLPRIQMKAMLRHLAPFHFLPDKYLNLLSRALNE